jgi:predicted ArsR family transcriptional regulator
MRGVAHIERLAIVYTLAFEPKQMHDIADILGIPVNLAAHHLKQLLINGWVLKTRIGRTVTYRLNEKAFTEFNRLFEDTPYFESTLSKYFNK